MPQQISPQMLGMTSKNCSHITLFARSILKENCLYIITKDKTDCIFFMNNRTIGFLYYFLTIKHYHLHVAILQKDKTDKCFYYGTHHTFVILPVQPIHQKPSVLKKPRISVQRISMQMTGIIIYNDSRSYKSNRVNIIAFNFIH
jgi:hypothetical protein